MIFVSVGTLHLPFDRFAKAVKEITKICRDELVIQYGHTHFFTNLFQDNSKVLLKPFFSDDEMSGYMNKARITVVQAGEGSFIKALESCKTPPIIVPRNHLFREHVDDQQMLLAEYIASQSKALVAFYPTSVPFLVKNYEFESKPIKWKRHKQVVNKNLVYLLDRLIVNKASQ